MAEQKTITVELTLHEAVTLWADLDARLATERSEVLRWVRDRVARAFADAVDYNIETAAKQVKP